MEKSFFRISEIFSSIQGESTLAGLPTTFIRLAGCNLNCRWCDTRYGVDSEGDVAALHNILKKVENFANRCVCITGGEPLLHENINDLINALKADRYEVSVETNGSLNISPLPDDICRVVDVKCPSSGENDSFLIDNLKTLCSSDNLKFVIADKNDFDWAIKFIRHNNLIGRCPVLFSPAAIDSKLDSQHFLEHLTISGREIAEWILEIKEPIRLQLQLHRLLWPERRKGV